MWYNQTELKSLKGFVTLEAWASGGSAGSNHAAGVGAGTQTAALTSGGREGAGAPTISSNSEEYNGSSWSEGNNMNTAITFMGSCGSQTAALSAAGRTSSGPTGNTGITNSEKI